MKKLLLSLLLVLTLFSGLFAFAKPAEARYVSGYYRSNGSYVSGYYRSRPNAYTYDNYSYRSPSYSNGYGYNKSYYSGRSYSSSYYTPSFSDSGYGYEKSLYNSKWGY